MTEDKTSGQIMQGNRRMRRSNYNTTLNSRFAKRQLIVEKPKEKWVEIRTKIRVPIIENKPIILKFKDGSSVLKTYKRTCVGFEEKVLITKRLAKPTCKTIVQFNFPDSIVKKIRETKQQIEEQKRKREEEQKKMEEHYKKHDVCPTCKKTERDEKPLSSKPPCQDPWHIVHEGIQEQKATKEKAEKAK